NIVEYIKGIFGIIVFLLLWEVCSRFGIIDSIFIPPVSKICAEFWKLLKSGELGYHTSISLWRALMGLGLGIAVAVPLGLLVGQIPIVERFLDPILQTFRQTSTLALMPVFILLLGLGETSKVAMIFWGVSWPILLSTISGVKSVDPLFIKAAKSMNESMIGIFRKIILPASLPHIFTGIRLGATSSIMLLIVAEMVGASSGLGFLIHDFEVKYEIPKMFAVIALFSILGLSLNYILVVAEKKIIKWKPDEA
ncbi:MAG: ABC transporter permease, partial [Synergistaceae bacterium]|nr:ABC transporter permease [Synergistaceae bacterium]